MIGEESGFFVSGGTLEHNAPCYVRRHADDDLFHGLMRREFCYVLTSRQMGKSSLMVRTAAGLRKEGCAVVLLDLTMVGRNVTVEQWYYGLLSSLGQQLDLRQELRRFWAENELLGPAQRWMSALRDIVLPALGRQALTLTTDTDTPGPPLVIFIDEIDSVRSLPFATDELFAAIRECHNRRAQDAELGRLTFCLLGVATPSDLISDTRTTPFNIGRRIDLTDFTREEAYPLRIGLELGEPGVPARSRPLAEALLTRVFHWTGGHPYLTQRLCQAIAHDPETRTTQDVDRHCEELFLAHSAADRDDNLLFVRERLLKSEVDLSRLLPLYARVHHGDGLAGRFGGRVRNEPASPLVEVLRLSGVVRVEKGLLRVRNRIYGRVFNPGWVTANLPDAELRRQRVERRRRLTRNSLVTALVVLPMGGLTVATVCSSTEARTRRETARLMEYVQNTRDAGTAIGRGEYQVARDLLEKSRPRKGEEDLRGWEWRHFWRLSHQELLTLRGQRETIAALRFLPGTRHLVGLSRQHSVQIWDLRAGVSTESVTMPKPASYTNWTAAAISEDANLIATATGLARFNKLPAALHSRAVEWEVRVRRRGGGFLPIRAFSGSGSFITMLAWSPDGARLAAASADVYHRGGSSQAWVWDIKTGRMTALAVEGEARCAAYSSDGEWLAVGSHDGVVRVFNTATHRESGRFALPADRAPACLAFSPRGRLLAVAGGKPLTKSGPGVALVWDTHTQRTITRMQFPRTMRAVSFAPGGRSLGLAGDSRTVLIVDPLTGKVGRSFRGDTSAIHSLQFSPDGRFVATANEVGMIRLWAANARRDVAESVSLGRAGAAAFTPNARRLAVLVPGRVKVVDVPEQRVLASCPHSEAPFALSPDGAVIASPASGRVRLIDVTTQRAWAIHTETDAASRLAFSPDGTHLAIGTYDGSIHYWDLVAARESARYRHTGTITSLGLSPDATLLAAISREGSLRVWNLAAPRQSGELAADAVGPLAFSPDGRWIAFGDGTKVRLRELAGKREIALLAPAQRLMCLAYSPDGRTLATGTADSVDLWSVATGARLGSFNTSPAPRALGFAPDGATLHSIDQRGVLHTWRAELLGTGLFEPKYTYTQVVGNGRAG